MEDLRTINSELQTVLNLSIASTSSEDLSFPQEEVQSRLKNLIDSAKRLELWFVEGLHGQQFPPNENELDRLRSEVATLRESLAFKTDTLQNVTNQAPEWTKELDALHTRQLTAMFDLVPLRQPQSDANRPHNVSTSATDDLWWGQPANDESEDL